MPPAVHIHSVAPLRDLRPQSLPAILQILSTWSARCDSVVSDLDSHISSIRSTARERAAVAQKRQDVVDSAVLSKDVDEGEKRSTRSGRGQRGSKRDLDDEYDGSDGDGMDVDEGFSGDLGPVLSGASGSRGTKRNRGKG
jgi:COP9 signalosome complex subunit 7